jgi:hypothetical protein
MIARWGAAFAFTANSSAVIAGRIVMVFVSM